MAHFAPEPWLTFTGIIIKPLIFTSCTNSPEGFDIVFDVNALMSEIDYPDFYLRGINGVRDMKYLSQGNEKTILIKMERQ
jgi:hypothetical protein